MINADATEEEIREFLRGVKATMTSQVGSAGNWYLLRRTKNINSISSLGFTIPDVRNTILSLLVSDYCGGPIDDSNENGKVWIFGKNIHGKEIYIKLKLATISALSFVRIISFHVAEEALCYPFRDMEGGSNNDD